MKKILLSLVALVAASFALSASETTLNFKDPASLGYAVPSGSTGESQYTLIDVAKGITATPIQIDFANTEGAIASNSAKFWNGTSFIDLRVYKGGNFTFKTTNGENISEIVFEGNKIAVASMKFDSGSYTYDSTAKKGTWVGDAASVNISILATLNITSATVTTVAAASVATPAITPNGGTFYTGVNAPVEVSMSCATEGATITYNIDGGDVITYTGAFTVDKSCSIMAQATKDGAKSNTAEVDFVISSIPAVANIAAFNELAKDDMCQFSNPLTVVNQAGNYLFVKDETGTAIIFGSNTPDYNSGDVIPAGVSGTVGLYGGQIQLNPIASSLKAATPGTAIEPTKVNTTSLAALDPFQNAYVTLENVSVALVEGKTKNYTITDAEGTFPIYNSANITITLTEGGTYDIIGFGNIYGTTKQVLPISVKDHGGVNNVETNTSSIVATYGAININAAQAAQAVIVNAAGQVIAQKAVTEGGNSIAVAPGFYIVKVSSTVAKVIVK